MHVPAKNPTSKFFRRRASHQQPANNTPSDTPHDQPGSPASTTEAPSMPTQTPSLVSPVSRWELIFWGVLGTLEEGVEVKTNFFRCRYESDNGGTHQEESDTGANSSESEYLLSDPTGYRTQEFSPDKKVQFDDGKEEDKEKPHKEKKKKKWVGFSLVCGADRANWDCLNRERFRERIRNKDCCQ